MHRIMTFAGSIVMFLFFLMPGTTCLAQEGLPRGDYQQTCQRMRMEGDTLHAECQKRDGGWRGTSINARDCREGIINDDGNLRCGAGGEREGYRDRDRDHDRDDDRGRRYEGDRDRLPPGDYKETCRDMRVEGNTLHASCQKRNGQWRDTSLSDLDRCQSSIVNNNGKLRCSR